MLRFGQDVSGRVKREEKEWTWREKKNQEIVVIRIQACTEFQKV